MDKIILFDIDKTLFDRDSYLENFYRILSTDFGLSDYEVDRVKKLYFESKNEYGYFSNEAYVAKISALHPDLGGKLNFYFQAENLTKFLFDDVRVLFEIKVRIGIFSKGDNTLQRAKIENIKSVFEEDLIYIFHDKILKLEETLEKHKDSEVFLVEDQAEVLLNAKDADSEVKTVLIDRGEKLTKVNGIDFKISSLFDIISILNEKTT